MRDNSNRQPQTTAPGEGLSRRRLLALGSAVLPAGLLLPRLVEAQEFSQSPLVPGEARGSLEHRFWKELVDEFPLEPDRVHFDSAEYGIPPLQSLQRMHQAALAACSHITELDAQHALKARSSIARFIGAEAEEIALTPDATAAMGLVADALPLAPGARVVISTHEPASSWIPWIALANEKKVDLQPFDPVFDRAQDVSAVRKLLAPGDVLVVSQVTPTQGSSMPLHELADVARQRQARIIVNGSHALGIQPVDLSDLQVDAYVASGHGWLLAPVGTAFLYVRRGLQPLLKPRYLHLDLRQPASSTGSLAALEAASDLEMGTVSAALAAGIEASLAWLEGFGLETLLERTTALATRLHAGLSTLDGVEVVTPEHAVENVPIVSFRITRRPNSQVATWLRQEVGMHVHRIDTRGLNAVRASIHLINQVGDVDWLLEAARTLA